MLPASDLISEGRKLGLSGEWVEEEEQEEEEKARRRRPL